MSVSRAENGGKPPVTFQQVFEDELKQIEQSRAARNPDAQPRPERSLIGLAFSGGGIRSACFNLGILQALAENRLLHKFDYLSTVSGGGYIGSWLAAVTRRLMATVPGATFANVEQALAPSKYEPNKRNEPTFLHWLRMYSSYLTPRKGLVSGDTWAAVGTWMRNVFLNQVILGLMFVGAFVLCHAVLLFFVIPETERVADIFFIWIGGDLLFLAAISIAFNVVDLTTITGGPRHWFQRIKVTATVMVPCFMASVLLNCGLWQRQPDLSGVPAWQWALAGAGFNLLVWGVVTLLVFYRRLRRKHRGKPKQVMISVRSLLIFSLIAGAAGACLLREYTLLLGHLPDFILTSTEWVVVIFGSGAVMLVLLITGALHLGLVGLGSRDLVREWWARTGGYLMLIIIGWLLLAGTCAFGPLLIRWAIFRLSGWQSMTAALLWIAHNYLGAKAAYYAKPSSDKEKTSKGGSEGDCTTELEAENSKTAQAVAFLKSPRILESIAKVAPYVFAAGLILLLSTAVHIGTGWVFDPAETWKLWHSQLNQGPKTAAWLDLSDLYWKIQESTPYRSLFVGGGALALGGARALLARGRERIFLAPFLPQPAGALLFRRVEPSPETASIHRIRSRRRSSAERFCRKLSRPLSHPECRSEHHRRRRARLCHAASEVVRLHPPLLRIRTKICRTWRRQIHAGQWLYTELLANRGRPFQGTAGWDEIGGRNRAGHSYGYLGSGGQSQYGLLQLSRHRFFHDPVRRAPGLVDGEPPTPEEVAAPRTRVGDHLLVF